MIEESKSLASMYYTYDGNYERPERCNVCDKEIPIGSKILRDSKTKHLICNDCIKEISKLV